MRAGQIFIALYSGLPFLSYCLIPRLHAVPNVSGMILDTAILSSNFDSLILAVYSFMSALMIWCLTPVQYAIPNSSSESRRC